MINLKIKTNGTVRNLTLPYPGQSIPDIIEKNSVVTVSEVTEPESLKYMEGHEWNIDEINFLAKRMEACDSFTNRRLLSYGYVLHFILIIIIGRYRNVFQKIVVNIYRRFNQFISFPLHYAEFKIQ